MLCSTVLQTDLFVMILLILDHHHPTLVVLQTDSMRASLARIAFLISHLSSTVCASRFSSLASSFFCY